VAFDFTKYLTITPSPTSPFRIGESSLNGQKMKCGDFHTWFAVGVHEQWLDIIFVKALNYIDGALERDSPENGSKCSSSVVDVLEIFKMVGGGINNRLLSKNFPTFSWRITSQVCIPQVRRRKFHS